MLVARNVSLCQRQRQSSAVRGWVRRARGAGLPQRKRLWRHPVTIVQDCLAPCIEEPSSAEAEPVDLQGTLRYADATHHKGNRIKIVDAEQNAHLVMVPEGMMNDIVRPMWNLVVAIKGVRRGKSVELREIREVRDD